LGRATRSANDCVNSLAYFKPRQQLTDRLLISIRQPRTEACHQADIMVGVAAGALMIISRHFGRTHGADQNAAPNLYRPPRGKSIWVFDRCPSNDCSNSMMPPIQTFDAAGNSVRAFGANRSTL
jgi:hypothetical protein